MLLDKKYGDTTHVFKGRTPATAAKKAAKQTATVALRERGQTFDGIFKVYVYKVNVKKKVDQDGNRVFSIPPWTRLGDTKVNNWKKDKSTKALMARASAKSKKTGKLTPTASKLFTKIQSGAYDKEMGAFPLNVKIATAKKDRAGNIDHFYFDTATGMRVPKEEAYKAKAKRSTKASKRSTKASKKRSTKASKKRSTKASKRSTKASRKRSTKASKRSTKASKRSRRSPSLGGIDMTNIVQGKRRKK